MITLPWPLLVTGLCMVFIAGLIRGFSGFGFAVVAVPLLSLVLPPVMVVPTVLLLQFGISLDGLPAAWAQSDRRSLITLAVGAAMATPLGLWMLTLLPASSVRLVIAGIVALAVVVLATGRRLARTPDRAATLGFGLLCGFFNGLAGIPGPPVIAFYLAAPFPPAAARSSMIVLWMCTSVAGLVPLAAHGYVQRTELELAALGLPAVWFGSRLGTFIFRRSRPTRYRHVSLVILAVTACLAASRAILDLTGTMPR